MRKRIPLLDDEDIAVAEMAEMLIPAGREVLAHLDKFYKGKLGPLEKLTIVATAVGLLADEELDAPDQRVRAAEILSVIAEAINESCETPE